MATILMPIPNRGFDPTEAGVPWRLMRSRGYRVVFATPDGNQGQADPTLITGKGLGLLGRFMMADANGRSAYEEMTQVADFQCPIRYDAIRSQDFDALLLPGGHAPAYVLISNRRCCSRSSSTSFAPASRSAPSVTGSCCVRELAVRIAGRSFTEGKQRALPKAWNWPARLFTRLHLLHYHQTYATSVEEEVRAVLANRDDFISGPFSIRRDSPGKRGWDLRFRTAITCRPAGPAMRTASLPISPTS